MAAPAAGLSESLMSRPCIFSPTMAPTIAPATAPMAEPTSGIGIKIVPMTKPTTLPIMLPIAPLRDAPPALAPNEPATNSSASPAVPARTAISNALIPNGICCVGHVPITTASTVPATPIMIHVPGKPIGVTTTHTKPNNVNSVAPRYCVHIIKLVPSAAAHRAVWPPIQNSRSQWRSTFAAPIQGVDSRAISM